MLIINTDRQISILILHTNLFQNNHLSHFLLCFESTEENVYDFWLLLHLYIFVSLCDFMWMCKYAFVKNFFWQVHEYVVSLTPQGWCLWPFIPVNAFIMIISYSFQCSSQWKLNEKWWILCVAQILVVLEIGHPFLFVCLN